MQGQQLVIDYPVPMNNYRQIHYYPQVGQERSYHEI